MTAPAAAPPRPPWQPIETAPIWAPLLLKGHDGGVYAGGFYECDEVVYRKGGGGLHIFKGPYVMQLAAAPEVNVPMPTHWMPLPAPPDPPCPRPE